MSPAIPSENPRTEQRCWVPSCCSADEEFMLRGWAQQQLSVGVLSSSVTCSHPRGCSKQVLVWGSWTWAKISQPLIHLRGVNTFCLVLHAGAFMWNHKNKGNYQPWVVTGSVFAWCCLCCSSRSLPSWTLRSTGWDVPLGCVGIGLCLPDSLASRVLLCGDESPVTFQKDDPGHTIKGDEAQSYFFLASPMKLCNTTCKQVTCWTWLAYSSSVSAHTGVFSISERLFS